MLELKILIDDIDYNSVTELLVPLLAEKLGLTNGYRLIVNQGDDAGQSVPHLHIHLLGGQKMEWNPA